MKRIILPALVVLGAWTLAWGEDFNQWRGSQRNGLMTNGPALDIRWSSAGPAKVWESEDIPSVMNDEGEGGGWGGVSVTGGKAYVYVDWRRKVVIATRTLSDSALQHLGWTKWKPPEEILQAVEEARTGAELAKLVGTPRVEWIRKWAEDHGTTAPDKKQIFNYVVDRLSRGKDALPLDLLAKLETIRNKEFPDQAALDAWFSENGVSDEHKAEVLKLIPTTVNKATDTLVCLNAADGKTLWKKQSDGRAWGYGACCTPTVVDGRCYFGGSDCDFYCLDAATGDEVWKFRTTERRRLTMYSGNINASPLVCDGKVIVSAGQLVALDQSKGTIVWKQPDVRHTDSSPVAWRSGDRTLVLCNSSPCLYGVDIQNGQIVWSVPAGGRNTPAVVGDLLVTSEVVGEYKGDATRYGLITYKLSAEKPEKLWFKPEYTHCGDASPLIYGNYVYSFSSGAKSDLCLDLATGKVAWEQKATLSSCSSPVGADGKSITQNRAAVMVIRATPEKYELLGKAVLPVSKWSSPTLADGRLYVRQKKNVACYDLTRPTAAAAPEAPAAK